MNTITKKYPEGITKEQWDDYEIKVEAHEKFIADYRFYLDRICNHLKWVDPNKAWVPEEIRERISSEIRMSHSMDAPNEPGYYRANND